MKEVAVLFFVTNTNMFIVRVSTIFLSVSKMYFDIRLSVFLKRPAARGIGSRVQGGDLA
jgi:hypothetical protein